MKNDRTQAEVPGGTPVGRPVRPHRVPTRAEVEKLMKRCQIGVGPRQMGEAHDIMAECYGTLGLLMSCVEFFHARATCECGDEFSSHDPGTCGNCVAALTCNPGA